MAFPSTEFSTVLNGPVHISQDHPQSFPHPLQPLQHITEYATVSTTFPPSMVAIRSDHMISPPKAINCTPASRPRKKASVFSERRVNARRSKLTPCSKCGTTMRHDNVRRHTDSACKLAKTRRYQCDCGQYYSRSDAIKRHQRTGKCSFLNKSQNAVHELALRAEQIILEAERLKSAAQGTFTQDTSTHVTTTPPKATLLTATPLKRTEETVESLMRSEEAIAFPKKSEETITRPNTPQETLPLKISQDSDSPQKTAQPLGYFPTEIINPQQEFLAPLGDFSFLTPPPPHPQLPDRRFTNACYGDGCVECARAAQRGFFGHLSMPLDLTQMLNSTCAYHSNPCNFQPDY